MFIKRKKEREPDVCIDSGAEGKKGKLFSLLSSKKRC